MCQNALIYRFTPVTDSCNRGKFLKKGVLTQPHLGNIIAGSLPATPLLNSNYDASFIAGILQLRYIYSMPVERIIKLFAENGFEMNKSTAHGLIRKAAQMLDVLQEVLRDAVHEDDYLDRKSVV